MENIHADVWEKYTQEIMFMVSSGRLQYGSGHKGPFNRSFYMKTFERVVSDVHFLISEIRIIWFILLA